MSSNAPLLPLPPPPKKKPRGKHCVTSQNGYGRDHRCADRDWSEKNIWVDAVESKNNHSVKHMIKYYVANSRESLCPRTPSILYKFILELHTKESFGTAKQYYETRIYSFLEHFVACTIAGELDSEPRVMVTIENCFRIWRYSTRPPWKLVSFPSRIICKKI